MDLVLDILQGVGLAALAGFRPFAAAAATAGLAAADVGISFDGTSYSFLESAGAIGALVFLWLLALGREGRFDQDLPRVLPVAGLAFGALLFAGSLADGGHPSWPGLVGGAGCAALAVAGTHDLLRRAGSRMRETPRAIALAADGLAAAGAVLVVLAPPVSIVLIGFVARLAAGARRRGGERFAGLRVLR